MYTLWRTPWASCVVLSRAVVRDWIQGRLFAWLAGSRNDARGNCCGRERLVKRSSLEKRSETYRRAAAAAGTTRKNLCVRSRVSGDLFRPGSHDGCASLATGAHSCASRRERMSSLTKTKSLSCFLYSKVASRCPQALKQDEERGIKRLRIHRC